jgi:hypothetical protein
VLYLSGLAFASNVDEVRRSEEARALWREIYPELSEGKPGLAGALLARGEAHVMRLVGAPPALVGRNRAQVRSENDP